MSQNVSYKYFLLGDTVPVRVTFNERGLKMGAETPDPEVKDLKLNMSMLSRLEQSYEVDEIDHGRFDALCNEIYSKKKTRFAPGGMS